MSDLKKYWPSRKQILECIPSQAEDLSDGTFLAIHEPMTLKWEDLSGVKTEISVEDVLHKVLTNTDGPIPIEGESGAGKSHLIRWLDTSIKARHDRDLFHVVRIPKNASLRSAIEAILEGLDDKDLSEVRRLVSSVAEGESEHKIAQRLILEISNELTDKYDQFIALKKNPPPDWIPDEETKNRYQRVAKHYGSKSLPSLIGDPEYQRVLLQEGSMILKFARWIAGGETGSGVDQEFVDGFGGKFESKELNFLNIRADDLNLSAREYLRDSRAISSEKVQEEIAEILTEAMYESSRRYASTWFRNLGVEPQQLFRDIRRYLWQKNPESKLVILVEDMVAISSIEKVLIECLLESAITVSGKETCQVLSAIATTNGYQGYLNNRSSLRTRSDGNCLIDNLVEERDSEAVVEKATELIGRYINAARYGKATLDDMHEKGQKIDIYPFPPEWGGVDSVSNAGFLLFPFTRRAIRSLVALYAYDGAASFSPRRIIKTVIHRVLNADPPWESPGFPQTNLFPGLTGVGGVLRELKDSGISDPEAKARLLRLWSGDAPNLATSLANMPVQYLEVFGLSGVKGSDSDEIPQPIPTNLEDDSPPPQKPPSKSKTSIEISRIEADCDSWLAGERLHQDNTREVRGLFVSLVKSHSELQGVQWNTKNNRGRDIPLLSPEDLSLPCIQTPPSGYSLPLLTDENYKNNPDYSKEIISSFLRLATFRDELAKDSIDKDLAPYLITDLLTVQNFVADWVDAHLSRLIVDRESRQKAQFGKLVDMALKLGLIDGNQASIEIAKKAMRFGSWVQDNHSTLINNDVLPELEALARSAQNFYKEDWPILDSTLFLDSAFVNYPLISRWVQKELIQRAVKHLELTTAAINAEYAQYDFIYSTVEGIATVEQLDLELESLSELITNIKASPLASEIVSKIPIASIEKAIVDFRSNLEDTFNTISGFINLMESIGKSNDATVGVLEIFLIRRSVFDSLKIFSQNWMKVEKYLSGALSEEETDRHEQSSWDKTVSEAIEQMSKLENKVQI